MSNPQQKNIDLGNAKVTLNPAHAQVPKPGPTDGIAVTDALGRVIRLKKPGPLARLDFTKAAGGDKINVLYLAEVAHLQFVSAIDDAPVATPSSEAELRALYKRLGDEGNEAAQRAVGENFMSAQAQQAQESELKNS